MELEKELQKARGYMKRIARSIVSKPVAVVRGRRKATKKRGR
jgi:hypothetical protein